MAKPARQSQSDDLDDAAPWLDKLGHAAFRPGQAAIVSSILAGEPTLGLMPTGSGKSLCYQLPALMQDGFGVVVSPLIALMENQVAGLKARGVDAAMIHSGRERHLNVEDWRRAVSGEAKLLYMSPERLMTARMLDALRKHRPSLIAIDEAHCISQWGHQFRAEYRSLGDLRTLLPETPLAAFTATADDETQEDIVGALFGGEASVFRHGFDRPNLFLNVHEKEKDDRVLFTLMRKFRRRCGIIYCRTRKNTELTAERLAAAKYKAVAYHAGLPDDEKADILARFVGEKDLIVCATVAFGMGIDRPDVRFVIHRDLPASLEAYYQEIGRAGRDGEAAEAHLIFGYGDLVARRRLIDNSDAPDPVKRAERRRLDALVEFCDAEVCRRQVLLPYFGEKVPPPCGQCDVCEANGL